MDFGLPFDSSREDAQMGGWRRKMTQRKGGAGGNGKYERKKCEAADDRTRQSAAVGGMNWHQKIEAKNWLQFS
jgi:hypothetical protein